MRKKVLAVGALAVAAGIFVTIRALAPREMSEPDTPSSSADRPGMEKSMDMDDRCWQVIETTIPPEGVASENHVEAIIAALQGFDPKEIVAFDRFVRIQLNRAYRNDLWAVAYIALGGCGDDGFEYFRLWVIAHGKEYFERALGDPERAVDDLKPGDEGDCESLLYAATEAYEAKTGGQKLPWDDSVPRKDKPDGEPWGEYDVGKLYPELAERFGWK
jgi:hypothetical protein